MKNRTILGIVCIILAVVISFVIVPMFNKITSSNIEIVRVIKDIQQGQQITENDIDVVTVGGNNLPQTVIKDKKLVIGKFAACDIKADDYLLPSKIKDTAASADDVFKTLDGTNQAMSITIGSFASGLSGKLLSGDIISVIVTGNDNQSFIPPELTYVRVITTTASSGNDKDKAVQKSDGSYELPSTITLLVNPEQAKLLAQYEANGKLHIILVYRGDENNSNKYLEIQDEVFKNE